MPETVLRIHTGSLFPDTEIKKTDINTFFNGNLAYLITHPMNSKPQLHSKGSSNHQCWNQSWLEHVTSSADSSTERSKFCPCHDLTKFVTVLLDPSQRALLLDACCVLIDQEEEPVFVVDKPLNNGIIPPETLNAFKKQFTHKTPVRFNDEGTRAFLTKRFSFLAEKMTIVLSILLTSIFHRNRFGTASRWSITQYVDTDQIQGRFSNTFTG